MTRKSLNRVNASFAQNTISVRDFGVVGDSVTDFGGVK